MKTTNLVINDAFRQRSDFLLTLFSIVGVTFDVKQMSLAIGSHNDVLLRAEYPDNVSKLLQLMVEHGLIQLRQSCETLIQNKIASGL